MMVRHKKAILAFLSGIFSSFGAMACNYFISLGFIIIGILLFVLAWES